MVFAMDVRFRHSFHEIESLDIPNILFPSQCRKLYQVIGIGIQEEFRNPYVIIKEQHGPLHSDYQKNYQHGCRTNYYLLKGASLFPYCISVSHAKFCAIF